MLDVQVCTSKLVRHKVELTGERAVDGMIELWLPELVMFLWADADDMARLLFDAVPDAA